jgi:TonB family protein
MTDATLRSDGLEPWAPRPPWLRPAVLAIVIVLHAAGLAVLPRLAWTPPAQPREIIVDIEREAPEDAPVGGARASDLAKEPNAAASPPAKTATEANETVALELARPQPEAARAPEATTPPPPVAAPPQAPPAETQSATIPAPPRVAVVPPPAPLLPPAESESAPGEAAPAPVEQRAANPPPPQRAETRAAPKPTLRPNSRPTKLARAEGDDNAVERDRAAAEPRRDSGRAAGGPPAPASSPAAGGEQLSAYMQAISSAIRSRLSYPPAARARGARGVVGVAFSIGPSGAVGSFAITRSSGDPDLDAAARALVHSVRFPPPPGGATHVSTSFNYVPP